MTSTTCQGTKKDGAPCGAAPLPNSDFCRHHQPEEVDETPIVCGHVNAHYTGKGELACDLPQEHDGAHSAEHDTVDWKDGSKVFEGRKRTYWTDLAGTPVSAIEPDVAGLKKLQLERKLTRMAEQQ